MGFSIPSDWDIQDVSAGSPTDRILRGMAQRDYAANQVPDTTGFASFPVYQKNLGVTGAPYQWMTTTNYSNIRIQSGANLQKKEIWRRFQSAPTWWLNKFAEPKDHYNGLAVIPLIDSLEKAFSLAGIPGYRRYISVGGNLVLVGYGTMQDGDIIGPWILEDVAAVYSVFTHRIVSPSNRLRVPGHDSYAWRNCSGSGGTGQSGWEGWEDVSGPQLAASWQCSFFEGAYNGLCRRRVMGRNIYPPSDPPDSFLPHDGQRGYWHCQNVQYSALHKINILKAGQESGGKMSIEAVEYYSKSANAGAPTGPRTRAVYAPVIDGAQEGRYIKSMHHGAVDAQGVIFPSALYPQASGPLVYITGEGPEDPLDPDPPEKTNYVGAELEWTSVIYKMAYEH